MIKKSIGGYFGLELQNHSNYLHQDLIHLNTARNCLEYILKARKYIKVYIPYFTCDVILEPLDKLKIKYEFYDVDNNLEPIFNYNNVKENEGFLITDYFGIKTAFIKEISSKIRNIIVDNAQSYFAKPIENIDTFYSPRKFVGVSDGGLLSTNLVLSEHFEKDYSYDRFSHLLKRIDLSAEEGYMDFQENDKSLENQSIKLISNLTTKILSGIDYEFIRKQRKENFNFLHKALREKNSLPIDIDEDSIPMLYPFRPKDHKLKNKLISEKIYCATYWTNVLEWAENDKNSYLLAQEIIALPIDQRYSVNDMHKILNILR